MHTSRTLAYAASGSTRVQAVQRRRTQRIRGLRVVHRGSSRRAARAGALRGLQRPHEDLGLGLQLRGGEVVEGGRARVRCRESAPERNPEPAPRSARRRGERGGRARARARRRRADSGSARSDRAARRDEANRRDRADARGRSPRAGHGARRARARAIVVYMRSARAWIAAGARGRERAQTSLFRRHHGGRESFRRAPAEAGLPDCRSAVGVKSSMDADTSAVRGARARAASARFGDVLAASPRRGRATRLADVETLRRLTRDAFAEITRARPLARPRAVRGHRARVACQAIVRARGLKARGGGAPRRRRAAGATRVAAEPRARHHHRRDAV